MDSNKQTRRYARLKTISLIGGYLLCLPDGGLWSWGNMSVYILSYMRMNDGSGSTGLESPWIISLFQIFWCFGMMLAGTIDGVLGRRGTILLGIAIFDGGFSLSYFTVQHSVYGLYFTHGALSGLGFGLICSVVLLYTLEWAGDNEGLFVSTITSANTMGGGIMIQLVSHYVNPDNEPPDLHIGRSMYYTQYKIVDNVPSLYLVLCGFSLACHVLGLVLIREKTQCEKGDMISGRLTSYENTALNGNSKNVNYSEDSGNSSKSNGINTKENQNYCTILETDEHSNNFSGANISKPRFANSTSETSNTIIINGDARGIEADVEQKSNVKVDYTPKEVLQTKTLYLLWFVMICNDLGYIMFANYYKTFGELFIDNDHSLADMGTVMVTVVAVTRIFWGMMIDRLGVKWIMILFSASFAVMFSLFFFIPMLDPWLYYIWCVVIASIDSGLYANFSLAALKLFGPKHFTFNMGLVTSCTILLNMVAPPIIRITLHELGWFLLFLIGGISNCISLLLVVCFLPKI